MADDFSFVDASRNVPEPATLPLLVLTLIPGGVAASRRRLTRALM
jgi:hypothetical protein